MDIWQRLGMSLALALISGACLADGYGQYQLERVVSIDPQQRAPRIDLDYLDHWLTDLEPYARTPARPFGSESERQRVLADLRALESVVGLAVLEQGRALLVRRSALLAYIAYQLRLPGAGVRADLAFNRWLLLAPEEGDAHYHYGRFLLSSAQYPRAVFYLRNAFAQGILDAELLLGIALLKQGERDEAAIYLQHYRVTHPDDPQVLSLLRQSAGDAEGQSATAGGDPYVKAR